MKEQNPQAGALTWLLDIELVSNPVVLNAVIANIAASVRGVNDIQFVIDTNRRKFLIYVEVKIQVIFRLGKYLKLKICLRRD